MVAQRLLTLLISLRYRVEVRGLDVVRRRGDRGILFLPNHPALVDPTILLTHLWRPFRPIPLGLRDALVWPPARWVARRLGAILMADPATADRRQREEVREALERCARLLESGHNIILWPSGRLARGRFEDVGGNSAAAALVERVPGARMVVVRVAGLWGSRFSHAGGPPSSVGSILMQGALGLIASGIVFTPKRRVELTFHEPDRWPEPTDRAAFNDALEAFYNLEAAPARWIPLTPWRRVRELPEPGRDGFVANAKEIDEAIRADVEVRLAKLTGVTDLADTLHLARDLGLDSLQRAELADWMTDRWGHDPINVDELRTVGDLMVAASGRRERTVVENPLVAPKAWFRSAHRRPPELAAGATVPEAAIAAFDRNPQRVVAADLASGARTSVRLLAGVSALGPRVRDLPGDRVGVMMPSSVGADALVLITMCAGRVPAMVNWTSGPRAVVHGLDQAGVAVVLTARALVDRLEPLGAEFGPYRDRFVFVEDLSAELSGADRLRALARARLRPTSLIPRRGADDEAVVLFTSGSEALPKAVPLTHRNLLTNLADIGAWVPFAAGDRLLSILPPFHSFGLTAGLLMPLLNGIPVVHHPNPRDALQLVHLVQAYGISLMGGTPTFLEAMMREAAPGQLDSLRLCVTGGEACPERVLTGLARLCPNARILEGYGVTECSPIVAINSPSAARFGTIGRPLPSVETRLLHPDREEEVGPGRLARLVARGPSVFSGYLGEEPPDPFVHFEGRAWYDTRDLVVADEDGFLQFQGRLKRFVKVGGEMVSLPAMEDVLSEVFAASDEDGPTLAVVATGDDLSPDIVLVSVLELDRAEANGALRAAGLSPLHSVHRVVRLDAIPTLGTGKTDHRSTLRLVSAQS
jgi:acyl-CoA synthetase (AMP-forming)/AMP-acid ligase II/1-acyl-sn-glycerol-3-phosphate acyltransferase